MLGAVPHDGVPARHSVQRCCPHSRGVLRDKVLHKLLNRSNGRQLPIPLIVIVAIIVVVALALALAGVGVAAGALGIIAAVPLRTGRTWCSSSSVHSGGTGAAKCASTLSLPHTSVRVLLWKDTAGDDGKGFVRRQAGVDYRLSRLRENDLRFECSPYVCPEPVLAK
jgi:hypothetical protein